MGSCFEKWGVVVFTLQFSSLYFFIFLFDTTGDSIGAAYGSIVPVMLICLGSFMSLGVWYYAKRVNVKHTESIVEDDAIELSKSEISLEFKSVSPLHENGDSWKVELKD